MRSCLYAAAATATITASSASASLIGASETFDSDAANWTNAAGTAFLDWFGAGGPDGSSYASGVIDLSNTVAGDTPVVLRAEANVNASGNALFGNYITAGVTEVRFSVRHDGPAPLTVFSRFASPFNFPGATAIQFAPVLPGVWTELSIAINPGNPAFITFEGSDFSTIFSDVGRVQFGVSVDETLAGFSSPIRLDIDNVRIVPAPGAVGVGALAFGAFGVRRRRS